MSGTPERILAARDAWLAAMDGCRAALAALEAHRLEANRLWFRIFGTRRPRESTENQ